MKYVKETIRLLNNSTIYYVIVVDMNHRYSYVSPSYNHNFSFDDKPLLGKQFNVTLHPDDVKTCSEVGRNCFQSPGKLFPVTLRKHNGKGGYMFTQWEFKSVYDDSGNPLGIFCLGYNISEQLHIHRELLQAKTEIENKNEKLNEIGFIQSHVIRKPLANVIGLSSVLSTMDIGMDARNINNMLMNSANELDEVIKSIVDKTT